MIVAGGHARINALFVPSLAAPNPSSTIQAGVLDFIQWDVIIASLSTFLAALWTTESFTQIAVMIPWFAIVGVVLGPGSALVGVFAWREAQLSASATIKQRRRKNKSETS